MSKDNPMKSLLDQVDIPTDDINSILEDVQDSFDLSRASKGKSKTYDMNSLLEDADINDSTSEGIVEDENHSSGTQSEGRKNLGRNLGLPSREDVISNRREEKEDRKEDRRSRKEDKDDREKSIVWKILGALGLAFLANKYIDKFSPEKGKPEKKSGLIVSVMRIGVIVVCCMLITSFAIYIVGAIKNLGVSPIDGFNESVIKASGGDKYDHITNVTGIQVKSYVKPYRIKEDGEVVITGIDGLPLTYPKDTLPKESEETGYVTLVYTTKVEDGSVVNLEIGELITNQNKKEIIGENEQVKGKDLQEVVKDKSILNKIQSFYEEIKSKFTEQ